MLQRGAATKAFEVFSMWNDASKKAWAMSIITILQRLREVAPLTAENVSEAESCFRDLAVALVAGKPDLPENLLIHQILQAFPEIDGRSDDEVVREVMEVFFNALRVVAHTYVKRTEEAERAAFPGWFEQVPHSPEEWEKIQAHHTAIRKAQTARDLQRSMVLARNNCWNGLDCVCLLLHSRFLRWLEKMELHTAP
jgi:hypothetical protein